MNTRLITPMFALVAMLTAGCAPATRVVLLPQGGSAGGAVEVSAQGAAAVTLDKPYEAATVHPRQDIATEQLSAQAVEKRYGQLLAVQPSAPLSFTLYFQPGTSELTPESASQLQDIISRATTRAGSDIVITGHTDSVGSMESNDTLSLQRASALRERVISGGFDAARVQAVGRGEREPIVPVPDETDEPKNRRAEIVVR
ncbi:MAG: OmpA family protein [Pseudomonadota bacterium]|nr:OmpA family protein [Pseudomonadota bacterium]